MDEQLEIRVTRFLERLTELSRAYGIVVGSNYRGECVLQVSGKELRGWVGWDEDTRTYVFHRPGEDDIPMPPERQIHSAPCEGTIGRAEVRRIVAEVCRERRENPPDEEGDSQ